MAALVNRLRCLRCQDLTTVSFATKSLASGFPIRHYGNYIYRITPTRAASLFFRHKSNFSYRLHPCHTPGNICSFATLAEIEKKKFQRCDLTYYYLLIRLEGLDDGILDNYCQFIGSTSKIMSLEVSKQFNLPTENFTQTLANLPDSYKKQSVTYHLQKHARIVEVKDVPVEKADIFIQYLQDNIPEGVAVQLELKKWQDFVSPPDPRILQEKKLEYLKLRERRKQAKEGGTVDN